MTNPARLTTFSCLLASCALCACDVDTDVADDIRSDVEFRLRTTDPSSSSTYNVCEREETFSGEDTVIRLPCTQTLFGRPLVLVLRGNGFEYTEYMYLLDHLAANGFIAVSVDLLASDSLEGHETAADTLALVLDDMLANWEFADQVDPTQLGLVGHSRGGLTVRFLADDLSGPGDDWTVRAIVTLAGKPSNSHLIVGDETEALLVLVGGDDADQIPADGYANYDDADSEVLFVESVTIDKSMKLLENGIHAYFADNDSVTPQVDVTKGYVLAFLAQHLLDDDYWYEDYIRGDDVPHGWSSRVASQFRDSERLVVDNFEDGNLANPSIGGGIGVGLGTAATVIDLEAEFDVQHETHALQLGGVAGGSVQWTFTGENVTGHGWLSLRAGYLDDNGARGLSVQLRNDGVWSTPVSLSSHGTIQQPMEMCETPNANQLCVSLDTFAHMGTIRIPLTAFSGDIDDVDGLRLTLGSKYATTTFIVDSIEFAGVN